MAQFMRWTSANKQAGKRSGYKFVNGLWYQVREQNGERKETCIRECQVPGNILDEVLAQAPDFRQVRQVAAQVMGKAQG